MLLTILHKLVLVAGLGVLNLTSLALEIFGLFLDILVLYLPSVLYYGIDEIMII